MYNFTEGIPKVEKEFYGQEHNHEPVSQSLPSEKKSRGKKKYPKDEEHQ
jgi:hypothetical protein